MMEPAPKLAISGTEFRGEDVDELLRAADWLEIDAVEAWYPENFIVGGDRASRARLLGWAGQVVAVSCGVEVAETHDVAGTARRLIAAVDLAAEIGAQRVNTYFGAPGYRDDHRAANVFLRHIERPLRRAEEQGVIIMLENEFNAFGRDHVRGDITRRPAALLDLLGRAGSAHLKLNFDAANFYCAGVEPYPYAYGVLAAQIAYLHVKDVRIVDPARADGDDGSWCRFGDYDRCYVTTSLGSGGVNWVGLLDHLIADGYRGALTLEPHARRENRMAAFDAGAQWMRDALRKSSQRAAQHAETVG